MTMPKRYERRVVKLKPGWYIVEEWTPCNCPDCDEDFHWMGVAGTSSKDDAERLSRR